MKELSEIYSTTLRPADAARLERMAIFTGTNPSAFMRRIILDALETLEAVYKLEPMT